MRHFAALLVILALAGFASAAKKPKDEPFVNFSGSLKRVTKKAVVIETGPDNEMTFVRTRRTTFTSGGRAVDGASLPQGIVVTVQAFEKMNTEVEAVSVTVAVPDQSPNK